jgi:hypothetical protein
MSKIRIMPGVLFKLSAVASMLLLCIFSYAQPPGGVPPPDPGENPEVPIGGIELLLLGGAAFGAKKIYDMTRRKK